MRKEIRVPYHFVRIERKNIERASLSRKRCVNRNSGVKVTATGSDHSKTDRTGKSVIRTPDQAGPSIRSEMHWNTRVEPDGFCEKKTVMEETTPDSTKSDDFRFERVRGDDAGLVWRRRQCALLRHEWAFFCRFCILNGVLYSPPSTVSGPCPC
ncbi:hypothetical protein PIB30_085555 [Stylosanthes scabra]|uniref:Uncharacterized protein n=1 Tax=Stylosanthes scabra TaxID=79078 RepID=A0ABU6VU21_9FABA|nr:hypothetical protein [Stylosanthes scabra]